MILHCMKSRESASVSFQEQQTICDVKYKEENQPQYESMVVLTPISVAEFIRNTLII